MLKFENTVRAQIGDSIRAFDFMPMPGRDDVYVEGQVVDINNIINAYVIRCTEDTMNSRIGQYIYVPVQVSFMEYEGRVVKLSA